MNIQGTAALVTGGGSGLGEATARELARLGAKVERRVSFTASGRTSVLQSSLHLANLFGEQAVFVVSRPER